MIDKEKIKSGLASMAIIHPQYRDFVGEILQYISELESENKRLTEVEEEHQRINGELREQLQMFIPRRRVRRVYKMLGKILRTDIPAELLEKELKQGKN